MSDDDRKIHAPEHQRPMHKPTARPACWRDDDRDWPSAPRFWDGARACANAASEALWRTHRRLTPSCTTACSRAARAISLWPPHPGDDRA